MHPGTMLSFEVFLSYQVPMAGAPHPRPRPVPGTRPSCAAHTALLLLESECGCGKARKVAAWLRSHTAGVRSRFSRVLRGGHLSMCRKAPSGDPTRTKQL